MKKSIYVLMLVTLAVTACKKSSDDTPAPSTSTPTDTTSNTPGIGTVPSTFTQKVLIEMFTSAAFGTCPDGLTKLDQTVATNPDKIIAACLHDADGMVLPQMFSYTSTFSVSSFPSGMVNRIPSLGNVILQPSQFTSNTTTALTKVAKCGLAINSTISGTTASIEVQAGFKETMNGTYNLTVFLTENEVTGTGSGFDQKNNYNGTSGSPYYNLGNPIVGFKHNNTVRKFLSATAMGDAIDVSKIVTGGVFKKTFTVDISSYNSANLYVVAFVNKVGTSATTHEVMNVQKAKINSLKNWD
jgi:hypothetical protein